MRKSKNKNADAPGKGVRIPLFKMIEHWTNKKSEGDRGGSFNVELYLDICRIKNQ